MQHDNTTPADMPPTTPPTTPPSLTEPVKTVIDLLIQQHAEIHKIDSRFHCKYDAWRRVYASSTKITAITEYLTKLLAEEEQKRLKQKTGYEKRIQALELNLIAANAERAIYNKNMQMLEHPEDFDEEMMMMMMTEEMMKMTIDD